MTNQLPEALLFDFDGVLADTEPVHWACWRDILAGEGIELDWEYYENHCIGLSEREFLAAIGRRASPVRSVDELWPLYRLKQKRFADHVASAAVISEPTREVIKRHAHLPLGVVTSSCRVEIEPILIKEEVLEHMRTCVYGDEVENLKPAPDPYVLALERLGVGHAVVFEDSEAGMASARAAGCRVVQVKRAEELPELVSRITNCR
jgi:beta-phosphoglucomutase